MLSSSVSNDTTDHDHKPRVGKKSGRPGFGSCKLGVCESVFSFPSGRPGFGSCKLGVFVFIGRPKLDVFILFFVYFMTTTVTS